jgi:RNA polymerase sigma factor (sigma-70 family)
VTWEIIGYRYFASRAHYSELADWTTSRVESQDVGLPTTARGVTDGAGELRRHGPESTLLKVGEVPDFGVGHSYYIVTATPRVVLPIHLTTMPEDRKSLVERLFAEHAAPLHAFLYRRLRRHPDAAELAQEAYLRLLRVTDLDEVRNPEAYLYTIASNLAKERSRQQRRDAGTVDVEDPAIQEQLAYLPYFGSALDAQQRITRLRAALVQLPPQCRAALVLQYWQGLSYQEIAQRLGVSTHTVKKHLSRALMHCRRRMGGPE